MVSLHSIEPQPGVQDVPQPLAKEVDASTRSRGPCPAGGHPPGGEQIVAAGGHHGPQAGVGGWIPRPRKLRLASVMIMKPMRNVPSTKTEWMILGRISRR